MLLQMRPEFHCLEGEDQKTDVYKNTADVYKNTARIHCLDRARIPMFESMKSEFNCLEE